MASPQFVTPRRVRPSRPSKWFTVAQANRTLPLVRRIVADVVKTHREVAELKTRLERALDRDQNGIQKLMESATDKLQGYAEELHQIGCHLKDSQMGLVDFTGQYQGRDICLCWKLGEEQITYWHDEQSGFAGRRPVSMLPED